MMSNKDTNQLRSTSVAANSDNQNKKARKQAAVTHRRKAVGTITAAEVVTVIQDAFGMTMDVSDVQQAVDKLRGNTVTKVTVRRMVAPSAILISENEHGDVYTLLFEHEEERDIYATYLEEMFDVECRYLRISRRKGDFFAKYSKMSCYIRFLEEDTSEARRAEVIKICSEAGKEQDDG
jgi:hypothetical protein